MRYLSIKNFGKYQHYKDRRPPWIKMHVSLLDDYDFIQLSDDSKAHLMLLWALASQMENKIPHDLAWITQRIGARSPVDVEELILRGFLEPYDESRARGKLENWSSRYVSAQTRADLLSAAQHKCAVCPATKHLEIDHIVPISQGGTGDPSNLQVLCRQCNRRKRARIQHGETGSAAHVRSKSLRRQNKSALLETETETETETERETEAKTESVGVGVVLARYQELHPRRKVTKAMEGVVRRALRDFSPLELVEAVEGNAADNWHRERRKHELSYVLRNADIINGFRDRAHQTKGAPRLLGVGGEPTPEELASIGIRLT